MPITKRLEISYALGDPIGSFFPFKFFPLSQFPDLNIYEAATQLSDPFHIDELKFPRIQI